MEASFEGWQDTRYVYTYSDWDDVWHRHLSYDLVGGNFYRFKIEPSGSSIYQYILWNGFWQAVYNYPRPDCGGDACAMEWFVVIYSDQNGEHPDWSNRINVETAKKHKNGSWTLVDSGVNASAENPYSRCVDFFAYDWGAVKGSC